ncbi:MAG: hypothetical protein EAZ47_03600 [Bacteroidetes bacterium]|nr:MAG: hypothetical protein EAZ47_03600 [Bacteroidota bacterium]
MLKRITIVFISILSICSSITAQDKKSKQEKKAEKRERINAMIKAEEEGALVYNKQGAFGIKLNTNGYGIFYERGKYKTVRKTNNWWIGLGEIRSQKEERRTNFFQQGPAIFLGNPYIFGKINNLYNFEVGFAQQRLIGGKGNKNGVAVSLIYGGGLSAGMLKPYILSVINQSTGEREDISFKQDSLTFLNPSAIVGGAGVFRGWSNLEFVPGVTGKVALRFDYGRFNEVLGALEAGLNYTYYTKDVQIMAQTNPQKGFLNAYLAIVFGKRK